MLPQATASSRSPLIPIDRTGSSYWSASRSSSRKHARAAPVVVRRRDGHEPLESKGRQLPDLGHERAQVRRVDPRLLAFPRDVHLHANCHHRPRLLGALGEGPGQPDRVHRVHRCTGANDAPGLVPLEMADEAPLQVVEIGQLLGLALELLHVALAEDALARLVRLADGLGRVALGHGNQPHGPGIAPSGLGGGTDSRSHRLKPLGDAHGLVSSHRRKRRRVSASGRPTTFV